MILHFPAFVSKFDASGVLVYSTYLGGTARPFGGFDESGQGIAVDSTGNAYVTGTTGSTNFPTTPGALQRSFAGGALDIFVTKLNATGSALIYSTYIGSADRDLASGIAIDTSGNAYIVGSTEATADIVSDVLVVKVNPTGSALTYVAAFGGHGIDEGYAVAVDPAGNAYVTGMTVSGDFPTTSGAFQTPGDIGVVCTPGIPPNGPTCTVSVGDAFVSKINAAGNALLYSTYLASNGKDMGLGIAVDATGNAYMTGSTGTGSVNPFPVTAGAFQPVYGGGISDVFVSKFNPTGGLVYSTFIGGSDEEHGRAIALDPAGHAYVTGDTQSFDFPLVNPLQASKGDDDSFNNDAFAVKLNATGSAVVYSTYLGGADSNGGLGIAADTQGTAYMTGYTRSANFPTANAFQPALGGTSLTRNAFVAKITDNVPQADLAVTVTDTPDPVSVGQPLTYKATVRNLGPASAKAVTLTVTLPRNVTLVSMTPSKGTCSGTSTLTCKLGTVNNGATVTVVVRPAVTGTITTTTKVTSTVRDPITTNNTRRSPTTVR